MRSAIVGCLFVFVPGCTTTVMGTSGGEAGWKTGPNTVAGVAAFDDGIVEVSVDLPIGFTSNQASGASVRADGSVGVTTMKTALAGTFTPAGALAVSGGAYSFTGNADSRGISGFGNDPASPGTFELMPSAPQTLCGSFSGTYEGSLGIVYAGDGNAVAVYSAPSLGTRGSTSGTVSGGSVSFEQGIEINGHALVITGNVTSVSGSSAQGSWSDSANETGTWSAHACP